MMVEQKQQAASDTREVLTGVPDELAPRVLA